MSNFDWLKAEQASPEPSMAGDSTTAFAPPQSTLDPDLFDGMIMRPEVRDYVHGTLVSALEGMGLRGVNDWLYLWVIGSSMSYQWHEQTGQPDIDATFAADMPVFRSANPDWAGLTDKDIATVVKRYIKQNVAPDTAHHMFGEHPYEVTFFWNPDIIGGDITKIHPYAAYDLIGNKWAVEPIKLPDQDLSTLYPAEWWEHARQDADYTARLVKRHNALRRELEASPVGSPGYHNAGSQLNLVSSQAQTLYDAIHGGRQLAFRQGGEGYGDWHNFRWQAAKQLGTAKGLEQIAGIAQQVRDASDTELYGGPIATADQALSRAMLVNWKPS